MLVAAASGLPFYCSYIFKSDERVAWTPQISSCFSGISLQNTPLDSMLFHDVSWDSMIFGDILWYSMIFYDIPWYSMIFHYVPWCFMIFHYIPSQFFPIQIPILRIHHSLTAEPRWSTVCHWTFYWSPHWIMFRFRRSMCSVSGYCVYIPKETHTHTHIYIHMKVYKWI